MKKYFKCFALILFLTGSVAFAQVPSSGDPMVLPDKELSVIFKDVTQHQIFEEVRGALWKSKVVRPFVMTKAQRGYIEFSGKYSGDKEALLKILHASVGGKLNIQAKSKEADALEVLITGISL